MFQKHSKKWAGLLFVGTALVAWCMSYHPGQAQAPKRGKPAFISGSLTIDKNNNYVITWKVSNPDKIGIVAYGKLTGLPNPAAEKWFNCYNSSEDPATNTRNMNAGAPPHARGVKFYFTDRKGNILIPETNEVPLTGRK